MSPSSPRRRPGCLSSLELDELLAGDLAGDARDARLRGHLDVCAECSARLASFASVEPLPAGLALRAAIARSGTGRARRRLQAFGAAAVFGCAAAGLLIMWPTRPLTTERTKGGLALTVFVKRADGTVDTVRGEGKVHPGDEMRFSLTTAAPGNAVVLGVDAARAVTLYVPAAGDVAGAVRLDAAGVNPLPGSIVADETLGAERVFAVLCPTPPDPKTFTSNAAAALSRAGGHPEAVVSLDSVCVETSVLLRKEPRPR